MKVKVRGDNIQITGALQEYVERKLGRLDKFFDATPTHDVQVTLSVIHGIHTVEVTMIVQGMIIRAEEKSGDMYASIDLVADKLEKQIEKHKSKVVKKAKKQSGRKLFQESGSSALAYSYDEEDDAQVVRVKRFAMKPMAVEEAIMQMDLLGHSFFVFSNSDTEKVNVVYRRNDGQYGLIEPAF
ncbi:ribosome-associated translation inhibitor RaiA [Fodinisporobacter ferrooxydans]|uniref:Ribosome hibernation promoting factor n=1 Tax=Fodinisporobacter ferrooxydans TaxID=2901836 RepID=A0ABY4CU24_9BACL|nr:ribosome-associated translation inhibitor RaiA [Alicyclobacillaceae bacterium MYW30-H2]